jgi:hypothetical protein
MMRMSSSATLNPSAQRRHRPNSKLIAAVAVVVVLAAVLAAFVVVSRDDDEKGKLTGSGGEDFSLSYPDGWAKLSAADLGNAPGSPIAGVRSGDSSGFVFLRREGRAPKDFNSFTTQFTQELDRRLPDFQKRSARIVKTAGGNAYFYSYIRKRKGTVHTVVVVPDGKRSYVLNTVSRGGEEKTARDIAQIILSFKAN